MAGQNDRRAVVTGMGAVCPVGNTVPEMWGSLIAGRSGIAPITRFDTAAYDVHIAGEVRNFEPGKVMDPKAAKRMDRFAQYTVAAAIEAVNDAGLDMNRLDPERVGAVVGSGVGGLEEIETQYRILLQKGPGRVSPLLIPKMMMNAAAGQVSLHFRIQGPNFGVASACASGAHAIGDALDLIRTGETDVVITGGAEAPIAHTGIGGFCAIGALSTWRGDPTKASRPFDRERDGFVIGEGAGMVILEELGHARKRGARIYAELLGFGMTADAYHLTAPDPDGKGAARAIRMALKHGGVAPEAVDYINAHGTSTPLNDKTETLAIKTVFGDHAKKLAVSSTKSMTGHLLGAASGLEFVVTVMAVAKDVMPPTINYTTPDPECDLDYVPNTARERTVNYALSNAMGFGGHNAILLCGKFKS
ncbi:MAG: beta-ketoacyl-ACP synthase II [Planctomycetota bacterium]